MSADGYDSFDEDVVIEQPSIAHPSDSDPDSLPPTPPPVQQREGKSDCRSLVNSEVDAALSSLCYCF